MSVTTKKGQQDDHGGKHQRTYADVKGGVVTQVRFSLRVQRWPLSASTTVASRLAGTVMLL